MSNSENIIECRHVSHGFTGRRVLSDITLKVVNSERIALVGPSGCGKSTLLNLLSGLFEPESGELKKSVSSENISFVFQEASLLPWKTVSDNVSLFRDLLPGNENTSDSQESHLKALLEQVNLWGWRDSYPDQLSGGMKMRVALARALYTSPTLLLLDEPFAALDDITRESLQDELVRLCQSKQMSLVLVTHNIEEAAIISDRIVVFSRDGRIQLELDLGAFFQGETSRRDSTDLVKIKTLIHAQWKKGEEI